MNNYRRVFIIGHPGAGKAVLAKALSEKLGWQVIDSDFGLEFRIGKPLIDILGKQGQDNFCEYQSRILSSQLTLENVIVITDGSIVCNEKSREILSSEFTVYLRVSMPIQLQRTIRSELPLLQGADLKKVLETLHEERDDFYEQIAHLVIDGDDSTLDKHVLNIIKLLEVETKLEQPNPLHLEKKELIMFHKKLHTPVHLPEQHAICLKLLASGKSSKEIARVMNISHRTVESYISKAMRLLGCSSSKELISLYRDND